MEIWKIQGPVKHEPVISKAFDCFTESFFQPESIPKLKPVDKSFVFGFRFEKEIGIIFELAYLIIR